MNLNLMMAPESLSMLKADGKSDLITIYELGNEKRIGELHETNISFKKTIQTTGLGF